MKIETNRAAMDIAIVAHRNVNHLYDGRCYSVHLNIVVECALQYIHIIPVEDRENVLAACWLHDVIEDCRWTYNDVKKKFNEQVAEIVYAVSNEKGKNRAERANDKYYRGIRNTKHATFVKMCDRLANIKYSKETNSRMLKVYNEEHVDFLTKIILKQALSIRVKYLYMIVEMETLLK